MNMEMKNKSKKVVHVSSLVLPVSYVEMVYDEEAGVTLFASFDGEEVRYDESISLNEVEHKPLSPTNDLVKKKVILFPAVPEPYESENTLLGEIQRFIHQYLDISPMYEKIAVYYVLLS